ncbi:MAG: hypothetical protein IIV65_00970 [Alistipes sp.]|nr:hypothetical protein [Alistipes sp.]
MYESCRYTVAESVAYLAAVCHSCGGCSIYGCDAGSGVSDDALGTAMRTKRPSMVAFKSVFDSGEIVHLHLIRGTWQLISAEDYWWM